MRQLTKTDLQQILKSYVKEVLEFDEDLRINGKVKNLNKIENHLETISFLVNDCAEALALNCTHGHCVKTADRLLKQFGKIIDKDSEDYKILCRELAQANIEVLKIIQSRENRDSSLETASYLATEKPFTICPETMNSKGA